MKVFTKKIIYSVIIFSVFRPHYGHGEHIGERAAKIMGASHIEATKIAAKAATDVAQAGLKAVTIGSEAGLEATKIAAEAGLEATKVATEGAITASEKFGSETINKIIPVLNVATGIYSIVQLAHASVDLYGYFYPSEEKKARINKAREENRFFEAKHEFRECLLKNVKCPTNDFGRPPACEELAHKFSEIAGEAELNSMISRFQKAYKA